MITFAVTAYNESTRGECAWLRECIATPLAHPGIDEVLVYDDGSHDRDALLSALPLNNDKLTVVLGRKNLGVFGAKIEAIAHASGEWVVTMDSDNRIDYDVLSQLIIAPKTSGAWYLPAFAMPAFNYQHFAGVWTLANAHQAIALPHYDCFFNTGNQTVHRELFILCFAHMRGRRMSLAHGATDSIQFNDTWLRSGGQLICFDGFHYHHRVNTGVPGNYERAPGDKAQLGAALLEQLRIDSLRYSSQVTI